MNVPHLGEVPYFRIPPRVTLSDLEDKLRETCLDSNELVRRALQLAQSMHTHQPPRYSGQPTLKEHIYPITMSILDYQLFQRRRGNLSFLSIVPEAVVVGLTHENFEEGGLKIEDFKRTFGDDIFEMVWILNQNKYLMEGASDYQDYTEMKFRALETAPWPAQVAGLADKINNTLCLYTSPYLNRTTGNPTPRMQRVIGYVTEIVLPFAKQNNPDFFAPMLRELLTHYRNRYPAAFGSLQI